MVDGEAGLREDKGSPGAPGVGSCLVWAMYWPPERDASGRGESVTSWSDHWSAYEIGASLAAFSQRAHYMFAIFDRHLRPDDVILEGGCGLGQIALYYQRQGHPVVGFDFDAATLRRIRGFDPDIALCCGDVNRLPYADASFDVYVSMGVVEHFRKGPGEALAEARRVLKPGGRLIISVPQANRFRRLVRFMQPGQRGRAGWWPARFGARDAVQVLDIPAEGADQPPEAEAEFFQYLHSPASFRERLQAAGLRVVEMHGVSIEAGIREALPPAKPLAAAPATTPPDAEALAPAPQPTRGPLRAWLRRTLIQERGGFLTRQLQATFGNMLLAVATPE